MAPRFTPFLLTLVRFGPVVTAEPAKQVDQTELSDCLDPQTNYMDRLEVL